MKFLSKVIDWSPRRESRGLGILKKGLYIGPGSRRSKNRSREIVHLRGPIFLTQMSVGMMVKLIKRQNNNACVLHDELGIIDMLLYCNFVVII